MEPSSFIYGFHGCSGTDAEKILKSGSFLLSGKDFDWLGRGAYFWENDPRRALEWAKERKKENPSVVGAIIDARTCLDLSSREAVPLLKQGFEILEARIQKTKGSLPENKGDARDKKKRELDCAVINAIFDKLPEGTIASVKSPFFEGPPVYPGAFFFEQTHVQICVKNLNCLMGVFSVPVSEIEKWEISRSISRKSSAVSAETKKA